MRYSRLLCAALVCLAASALGQNPFLPPDWSVGDVFVGVGNGSYQVWHSGNATSNSPTYSLLQNISDAALPAGNTAGCGFDLAYRFFGTNASNTLVDRYSVDNGHPLVQQFGSNTVTQAQSVAFDGTRNVYVGYAGGTSVVNGQLTGTIEWWQKDLSTGLFGFKQAFPVPVDTSGPGWIDLDTNLDTNTATVYYTSQGATIRTLDVSTGATGTFATLSGGATLFALRVVPGSSPKQVLVAAQGNVLLVNSTGVQTKYQLGNEKNLQALSLDASVSSRAWVGDASSNDVILFDMSTKKQIAIFNTGTGSAGPLGGLCVDGAFNPAELAAVTTFVTPAPIALSPKKNTLTFTSPFTSATFTETFADLTSNVSVTVRDSIVDPAVALSDPTVFAFNPGSVLGNPPPPPPLVPGNIACDTTLTGLAGLSGKCEIFEVEANPNANYTITDVNLVSTRVVANDLNMRFLRNLDEDITSGFFSDSTTSGTRTIGGQCVYTFNNQIKDEADFEICGAGFSSPASGSTFSKKQTSSIAFKFKVAPAGQCPNGSSPPACTVGGPSPCLSPLLMIVQLQSNGAAPVPIAVHPAGNSGGLPLFLLTGNTWQIQVKTDDIPPGNYIATMVDLGANVADPNAAPTSTIPSIGVKFTLR